MKILILGCMNMKTHIHARTHTRTRLIGGNLYSAASTAFLNLFIPDTTVFLSPQLLHEHSQETFRIWLLPSFLDYTTLLATISLKTNKQTNKQANRFSLPKSATMFNLPHSISCIPHPPGKGHGCAEETVPPGAFLWYRI